MRYLCIKNLRATFGDSCVKEGYFYSIISVYGSERAHYCHDMVFDNRSYDNALRISTEKLDEHFVPVEDFTEKGLFLLGIQTGVIIKEKPASFFEMIGHNQTER